MDSESCDEGLDDLRKKRLAYFQLPHKTETSSSNNAGNLDGPSSTHSHGNADNQGGQFSTPPHNHAVNQGYLALTPFHGIAGNKGGQSSTPFHGNAGDQAGQASTIHPKQNVLTTMKTNITQDKHPLNGEDFKYLSNGNTTSVKGTAYNSHGWSKSTESVSKAQNDSSAMPLRTSAFYFANPEKEPEPGTSTTVTKASTTSSLPRKEQPDDLDAYNETVERLIRATKEEIMGQKSSDDIWKKFVKDSDIIDEKTRNVDDKTSSSSVMTEEFKEKSKSKSVEEIAGNQFEMSLKQNAGIKGNDINANQVKDNGHIKHRTQKIPFDSYESRPSYSSGEPSQKFHGEQKDTQKSYTTSKVEEIFSSRQITQSQLQKSVSFIDSQEFEPIKEVNNENVDNSLDLSELGLSTHRPESDRPDDLKVAEEINLGDTVTKELRLVLGEEKFQEFLMKSKRDIADLHQDSGRKDKTPRLLKEKQIKPETPKSKPETPKKPEVNKSKDIESERPKSILKNKEPTPQRDLPMKDNENVKGDNRPDISRHNSLSEPVRNSMHDFTPRQSDGDAVEHMIGEYLLNKSDTVESKDPSVSKSIETDPITIPKLDLDGVSKPERPKLHRPKHEPPTIYTDRQQEGDQKESDRDVKVSAGKNYDQVTVPRNVAFSADEIYNQAYKGKHPNQPAVHVSNGHYTAGPHFQQGPQHQGPNVSSTGPPSVPMTPTTPVGHIPMSMAFDPASSYPNSPGFLAYSGDFSNYRGNFLRQSSNNSAVSDNVPIPHPPNQPGLPPPMSFSAAYPNYTDPRSYGVPMHAQHGVPVPVDQPVYVPHPPASIPSQPGHMSVSASHSNPIGIPNSSYQYPVMMMSPGSTSGVSQQFFYPQPPPGMPANMGIQVAHPANMGAQIAHPANMGAQMAHPYQMTSGGAQLYNSNAVPHTDSGKIIEIKAEVHQPPPTPSMSNAEVQTDRESSPDNRDKTTLVEESTFTSVSQLPENDKFVPHPPAKKKEGRPSPRWSHKADSRNRTVPNSNRHIDGIRQHHEQRRKENEEEKMTEDQIIANQKRFAKASLDRYFSSLENVYQSSTNVKTAEISHETDLPEVDNEDESESPQNMYKSTNLTNDLTEADYDNESEIPQNVYQSRNLETSGLYRKTDLVDDEVESEIPQNLRNDLNDPTVVDDVMSNVLVDNYQEKESGQVEVKPDVVDRAKNIVEKYGKLGSNTEDNHEDFDVTNYKREVKFNEGTTEIDQNERVLNIINEYKRYDFKDEEDVTEKDLDNEKDNDCETLVDSMANTDVTVQGGGLTDRLKDLGIDVSHSYSKDVVNDNKETVNGKNKKNVKKKGDKKGDKKGKVLIVCPECQGLNKQYMSWCTQCGEMLIGIEPMLVSKNRDGKIRTKPLSKDDDKNDVDNIRLRDSVAVSKEIVIERHSEPVEVNYVQHVEEKPFSLNLETIKADKDNVDEVLYPDSEKCSPIKSDGKDSGRPSSDDPDLDIQTQKIEEEVVNDICATIADPVLKGYVKSHFNKSKNAHENVKEPNDWNKSVENISDSDIRLNKESEVKTVKSFHHDIVDMNRETNGMANAHVPSRAIDEDLEKGGEVRNSWIDSDQVAQQIDYAQVHVSSKIKMFEQKHNHGSKNKTFSVNDESDEDEPCVNSKKGVFKTHEPEYFQPPPPIPNFSANVPVQHNELSLKLPANSMDYSTDMSQVVSQNFDLPDEKGDNIEDKMRKEKEKAIRKQARRNKRGHGAIDVEVFGYEESRESRNSSRVNHMIPMLNLAGNSSDEDDSGHSDFKPFKPELKQAGAKLQTKSSINAWEPNPLPEEKDYPIEKLDSQEFQPIKEENTIQMNQSFVVSGNEFQAQPVTSAIAAERMVESITSDVDNSARSEPGTNMYKIQSRPTIPEPGTSQYKTQIEPTRSEPVTSQYNIHSELPKSQPGTSQYNTQSRPARSQPDTSQYGTNKGPTEPGTNQYNTPSGQAEEWKTLFDPSDDPQQGQDEPIDDLQDDLEESVIDDSQPFLMQIINQSKPQKSKQRPKSASGKPVKSKVRQSIEEPGYQRKWNRSSTAWNTYNPGELNTSSSLRSSTDLSKSRASSLPRSRAHASFDDKVLASQDNSGRYSADIPSVRGSYDRSRRPVSAPKSRTSVPETRESVFEDACNEYLANQQGRPSSVNRARPFSADLQKRKGAKKKNTRGSRLDESLDLDLDLIEHRLPKPSMIERLNAKPAVPPPEVPELMLSPKSTYDRLIEMTPRIEAGTVSKWQCLPDEILLHIFAYLDQTSLTKCAQVCQQFYRVAMDECLWKYITIKKSDIDDSCLEEIAKRHPVSLALIHCYGDQVTAKGLRDLFKDCANTLKELNVARCSRGALHGDSLMLHAAARCHNLTHIDASWCALTDSGLMAISNCSHRIESLCINGCNAVSNDGLETTIKKHGTSLRVLEMFACFNLSPRGLRSVANNCINLTSLNLGQCYKLTDSCISQLSTSLGRVETLDLRGCKQIKDNCIRRIVKNCPRLKNLSLANCPSITDVSILEISTYLTDIRSLDLCGCKSITDGSIRALVNTCTNLRHIDISSTGCTHRSVSMIANFCGQRLETLKINFLSDVTEQSLIKLAKHCHRLKSVHMYGCSSVRNLNKIKEEHPSFKIEM